MKKKGTHIFRSLIITLVMSGLAAHLAIPFSSDAQKTAFTRWLGYNISDSGSDKEILLKKSIRELPEQSDDFWILIQQASRLIADHSDTFELPINNSDDRSEKGNSTEITNWLLSQWERYRHQSSGFNTLLPDSQKIAVKWVLQTGITGSGLFNVRNVIQFCTDSLFRSAEQRVRLHTIPHLSGISINAP